MKIAIIGPEVSGKTQLAWALATKFNGIATPEYARLYFSERMLPADHVLSVEEMREVMRGQHEVEQGDGLLFIDASCIHGPLYAALVYGGTGGLSFDYDAVDPAIMDYGIGGAYDAFILCRPHEKLEWEDDGLRAMPDIKDRMAFADACEAFIKRYYPAIAVIKIDAASWAERERQAADMLKALINDEVRRPNQP